jgi:hypothetical protein
MSEDNSNLRAAILAALQARGGIAEVGDEVMIDRAVLRDLLQELVANEALAEEPAKRIADRIDALLEPPTFN